MVLWSAPVLSDVLIGGGDMGGVRIELGPVPGTVELATSGEAGTGGTPDASRALGCGKPAEVGEGLPWVVS
jgi:hypothetical protein